MKRNLYSLMLTILIYSSSALGMEHKESQRIVSAENCQKVHALAKQAYQKGEFNAALQHFSHVIRHTKQQKLLAEALLHAADIYFQGNEDIKSNYKQALTIAQRAANFPESNKAAKILMGTIYAKGDKSVKQNCAKAIQLLNSVYSKDNCMNTYVDIELGKVYYRLSVQKRKDIQAADEASKKALKYFQQAIDRNTLCCPELPEQAKLFIEQLSKNKNYSKTS